MAKAWSRVGELSDSVCRELTQTTIWGADIMFVTCPEQFPFMPLIPACFILASSATLKAFLVQKINRPDNLAVIVKWRVQMKTRKKVRIENALGIWDKEVRFLFGDSRDAWRKSFSIYITQVSDWTYVAFNQWNLTLPDMISCWWCPVPLMMDPRDEGSDSLAF